MTNSIVHIRYGDVISPASIPRCVTINATSPRAIIPKPVTRDVFLSFFKSLDAV